MSGTTALEAAAKVLAEAGKPLHHTEITRRILERGLWQGGGKTPGDSVQAQISVEIKSKGRESRFRRVKPGVFALR